MWGLLFVYNKKIHLDGIYRDGRKRINLVVHFYITGVYT